MVEANARHLSSVVPVAVVLAFEDREVDVEEEDTCTHDGNVSDRGDFLPMARGPRTTAMLVDDW